jgi:uncharacterized repeat protein (TIGR01451 family)
VTDTNPANNNATEINTLTTDADLALRKTVNDSTPNVGDTVTFTVTLTNNGPNTATNVTVSDGLPAGLTLVSATPSQGSYAGGVWTVGTVTTTAAPTLTLTALVVSPNAETNTAAISHSDQLDTDTANNSASATVTPQQADLAVRKTISNPALVVGDTFTFTVIVTGNGPSTATGVQVTDMLPAGLTFVSSNPSQGSYDPATGLWNVGTVASGASATLTIQVQAASAGSETNSAKISHSDQFDSNTANNTGSVSFVVMPASPPVTVVSLKRFGYHHEPTLLVVGFSGPLDASSAQDLSNYSLVLIAHGGKLRKPLSFAKATYNPTAATVTLQPTKLLPLRFQYVLTINASTPTGVRDASGQLVDGDGNGIPGGNFVRKFNHDILAGKNRQFIQHKLASARPTLHHRLPALPAHAGRPRA